MRRLLAKRCQRADAATLTAVRAIADELGVERRFEFYICEGLSSPMLTGLLRPTLLLAPGVAGERLDFALRHELTHLRRKDIEKKLLLTAANAMHWFNPMIWLLVREADRDIEAACDEAVVANAPQSMRTAYCEAIFAMMNETRQPLATSFGCGKADMAMRFKNILDSSARKSGLIIVAVVLCLSVVLGGLLGCSQPAQDVTDAPSTVSATDSVQIDIQYYPDKRLPLDSYSTVAPLDFSGIEDMHYLKSLPSGAPDDCLSLSDALYCVNYARSIRYEYPASVYVYHDSFVDAQVTTTTVFGDGTPCDAWLANHDHTLPFHDSSEDYFSGDGCPAWAIRMQQLDSEATDIETIYVNALTGDLYNDTNSGGYVPSPFMERSMYSRVLNAIWCCQPALSSVYPAFPFVFADETVVGFDRISVTTDVGSACWYERKRAVLSRESTQFRCRRNGVLAPAAR